MYTVDATANRPIMMIDRHIGYNDEDGYGIDGAAFARELLMLDGMGKEAIDVWINSPGGNVMDGMNIYNAILKTKTKVNTVCVGVAASISAVIFQAGRDRVMCDYGVLMYHNPFGSESTDALKAMRDAIVTMICERSGMSQESCLAMMRRETFMNADEAMTMKLCDRIEGSADYNKKRMATAAVSNNAKGYYKEAQKIYNQLFKSTDMPDFAKIANKLGLVPESNEDAVLRGIVAIENRAIAAEAEVTKIKNQLTEANTKITTLEGQVTTLNTEKETAIKAAKNVQAKALIAGAVKIGAIKNEADTILKWEKKATDDYDGTKELLESIPVNTKAVHIQNAADRESMTALENAVAMDMAAIQNKLTGVK